jgi:phenylacetate-coenzyme A ligase PaaK-like adenylate-forming protein
VLKARLYRYFRSATGIRGVERNVGLLEQSNLDEYAKTALESLLGYVAEHNKYYSRFAAKGKLRISDLPVLTKATIRAEFDALSSPPPGARTFLNSSGGSTGRPQSFLQDQQFANWTETTLQYYFRTFHEIDPDRVRKAVLWGSEREIFQQRERKAQLANWLTNTLFLNTFRVSDDDWKRYVERINAFEPYFIRGYAGSLYELAKVIEAYDLPIHRPRFLYSSAEMLRDFMREKIEQVFGCKVHDFYGSREVGAIAGECRHGRRHVFTFNNWLEVGPDGEILVTNLHNYSMPLIRYAIGDLAALATEPCACGSTLPYLSELRGRVSDHFVRADGGVVHGEYFTHLFYERPWVRAFQANQLTPTSIELLIVKGADEPSEELGEIEHKIRLVMGDGCAVAWRFVDQIPKTEHGKHLFTRSLVRQ